MSGFSCALLVGLMGASQLFCGAPFDSHAHAASLSTFVVMQCWKGIRGDLKICTYKELLQLYSICWPFGRFAVVLRHP